jgi:hypothetical protein
MPRTKTAPPPAPVVERNYSLDMREAIDKQLAQMEEPYTLTEVATYLVTYLERHDKELLTGWLNMQVVDLLRMQIGTIERSRRTHNRNVSKRLEFGAMIDAHERGDSEPLTTWLSQPVVFNDQNQQKPLRDMTKPDLLFSAESYGKQEKSAQLERVFKEALARKVGRRTVGEVFTEEQIAALHESLRKNVFGD